MGWRVRLARGVLRAATWLAWRSGSQAAFERNIAQFYSTYMERGL